MRRTTTVEGGRTKTQAKLPPSTPAGFRPSTRARAAEHIPERPPLSPALTALLALTDDGVLFVDDQGMVQEANGAAATLLGLHGGRLVGRSLGDVFEAARLHAPSGPRLGGAEVGERLEQGARVRARPRSRAGSGRAVDISSARTADGGAVVLLRDVTALLAAEDRGLQYRQAIEFTLDGVYLAGGDELRIRYANPAAVRQSGWPREALVGRPLAELMPRLEPTPAETGEGEDRASPPVTTVLRGRGGRLIPVDTVVRRFDHPADGPMVMAIVRDAAERIESQVRLQRLVQQERIRAGELEATLSGIGDAVIVVDASGRVVLTNPATRDLFPGRRIEHHDDLVGLFDDPDRLMPRLGSRDRQGPVELRRAESDRWIELTAFPIQVAANELSGGMIVLARDATLARDARRIRETFLGILSHELRTPITTILGGAKVLRRHEEADYPLRHELLDDIEAEAERLYRLVEDLLVLARFEDRRIEPANQEPLLLRRLLPTLLASEEARWPGRRFEVTLPTGLAVVQGDRTYLEQILRNLLGNAAKYSPPDSPIEIQVRPEGDEVHVLVLDRGPGLGRDEADKLFDLYYRSPVTEGLASGAGIGLFVCRVLVEAMGGHIWARPRDGGGAEFGFALNVLQEESE